MLNAKRNLLLAALLMLTTIPVWGQHWVKINSWRFDNFTTPELPWERYRDTFIGVPPTRDMAASPFDVLFYDNLYKTELTKTGNCYGMALLSLLLFKNGGHQGFCAPTSQYPASEVTDASAPLTLLINQMHGHQVNLPTLRLFLDTIAMGKNRDGNYAYDQVCYYTVLEDPTLVSITKSLNPADGGHTMVAYKAELLSGRKRIFVYDPSRPWIDYETYYENNENVIHIDSGGNSEWEFEKEGGTPWSGSPSSGGNITITPLSITGPPSRLPTSLGLNALDLIATIFVSAEKGSLQQVTDQQGKRLFKPGTIEIDTNPATGILNLVPWYPSDAQGTRHKFGTTYFSLGNLSPVLKIEVQTGDEGYEIRLLRRRGMVRIAAEGGRGADSLTLENTIHGASSLVLDNSIAVDKYEVEFTQLVQPSKRIRGFQLSNLRVPRDCPVQLNILRNQTGILISSEKATVSYDLQLRTDTPLDEQTIEFPGLQLAPGRSQLLRPRNWRKLQLEDIEIKERPLQPGLKR